MSGLLLLPVRQRVFGPDFCFSLPLVHGRVRSGYEKMQALYCVIRHCFAWRSDTFWVLFKRIAVVGKCLPSIHVHNGGMNFVLMNGKAN